MNNHNMEPGLDTNNNTVSKTAALFYAAFGAFIAAILDTAINNPSNCIKFGEAIAKIFYLPNVFADTLGVIFVVIIAAVLARVDKFKTEKAAVLSGLMIFSTIALLMPIKPGEKFTSPKSNQNIDGPIQEQGVFLPERNRYHSTFSRQENADFFIQTDRFVPNATVLAQRIRVSSCKPSYWGFLGLGSLINNSMRTCPTDHFLTNGTRVRILDKWKTGAREYWYAEIEYQISGKLHTGWIQAGWKANPWGFLEPDKDHLDGNPV